MLRISTAGAFNAGVTTMQQRQKELARAQEQLVSGKRVDTPSDDPTAAARAERAMQAVARAEANQRALEASRTAMTLTESALGDAAELMQQSRELLVSAGNASFDNGQRQAITQQLRGLHDQLLQVANRGDGTGGFLFGRQNSVEAPFEATADATDASRVPVVGAQATSVRRVAAADEPMPLSLDGLETWMQAETGNGAFETRANAANAGTGWVDAGSAAQQAPINAQYEVRFSVSGGVTSYEVFRDGASVPSNSGTYRSGTAIDLDPGRDLRLTISGQPADGDSFEAVSSTPTLTVFAALKNAIDLLEDPLADNTTVTQAVQSGLRDVDQVMANVAAQRADAGGWLNRLDNIEQRLGGQKLQSQTERSTAEDLDMIDAVSEFSNKQSSYQAALQAYASVQKLSLFQYLNGG